MYSSISKPYPWLIWIVWFPSGYLYTVANEVAHALRPQLLLYVGLSPQVGHNVGMLNVPKCLKYIEQEVILKEVSLYVAMCTMLFSCLGFVFQ